MMAALFNPLTSNKVKVVRPRLQLQLFLIVNRSFGVRSELFRNVMQFSGASGALCFDCGADMRSNLVYLMRRQSVSKFPNYVPCPLIWCKHMLLPFSHFNDMAGRALPHQGKDSGLVNMLPCNPINNFASCCIREIKHSCQCRNAFALSMHLTHKHNRCGGGFSTSILLAPESPYFSIKHPFTNHRQSPFSNCISHIVSIGTQKQMVITDTSGIVAPVTDHQPWCNIPMCEHIGHAVCLNNPPPSYSELPIPFNLSARSPHPTRRIHVGHSRTALINLCPKAISDTFIKHVACSIVYYRRARRVSIDRALASWQRQRPSSYAAASTNGPRCCSNSVAASSGVFSSNRATSLIGIRCGLPKRCAVILPSLIQLRTVCSVTPRSDATSSTRQNCLIDCATPFSANCLLTSMIAQIEKNSNYKTVTCKIAKIVYNNITETKHLSHRSQASCECTSPSTIRRTPTTSAVARAVRLLQAPTVRRKPIGFARAAAITSTASRATSKTMQKRILDVNQIMTTEARHILRTASAEGHARTAKWTPAERFDRLVSRYAVARREGREQAAQAIKKMANRIVSQMQ